MTEQAPSFEKNLQDLEIIVTRMEKGELSLEESLRLFAQGSSLAKACDQQLADAHQKVQILTGVSPEGEAQWENFEGE